MSAITSPTRNVPARDYSLVGPEHDRAIARGLADAEWYLSPVPRERMQELVRRTNGRALRDNVLWFGALALTGWWGVVAWETWWAVPAFALYGTLYGSGGDSRWHECGHGTAFRTSWLNSVVYAIASFMVMREPVSWRWSHTRHHSDTIVVGRDPEIAYPRPTPFWKIGLELFGLLSVPKELRKIGLNTIGRFTAEELDYLPDSERPKAVVAARCYVAVLAGVVVACISAGSILPAMLVGLPTLYGRWLLVVYGTTQHAGLAEDVLDHRLNTRTVLMNPVHRWLYSNMNYHIEHHMFPNVPYHALPALHEIVRDDMPTPAPSILAAYREIVPALRRQASDPTWYIRREVPNGRSPNAPETRAPISDAMETAATTAAVRDGWLDVCGVEEMGPSDLRRVDHGDRTFVVCRTASGEWAATDGLCTHAKVHLADGCILGSEIECPKHNGRFDAHTGTAVRAPARVGLTTHEVRLVDGRVRLRVD